MALLDTISLSADLAGVAATNMNSFVLIKRGPLETERLHSASDLSNPELLIVKHQISGSEKTGGVIDRHLISFVRTERDVNAVAHRSVVNLTLTVPRVGLFDNADMLRQVAFMANLMGDAARRNAILRNES